MNLISEANAFQRVANKAVLVTVNQRLSRYLVNGFNQQQVEAGKTVWETPDILPYSAWLKRAYDQARYLPDKGAAEQPRTLLSPMQEHYIWEQVINESVSSTDLLQKTETARAACQAWDLCRQWHLSYNELSKALSEDTRAYLEWANAFDVKCRENNWLDSSGLPDSVTRFFRSGHIDVSGQLILAGFDELSPQLKTLVNTLEELGCRVFLLEAAVDLSDARRCELTDTRAEITSAAHWARSLLENNPAARIGIIVRDINALRPDLVRTFDDVLHPSMVLSSQDTQKRAYNISLGLPLSDYPVIRTALMILNYAGRSLSVDEYSLLLRSPFVGGADAEISKRAMLDARIRENGETVLKVSDMIYFSDAHEEKDHHPGVFCPELSRLLDQFKEIIKEIPKKQRPSAWTRDFIRLLDAMGWPKGRSLNSEEFQTVHAWHEALQKFSAVDTVCGDLDLESAIGLLNQHITAVTFQPETDDVPIQIMGMLEVTGERFDYAWIMGLDAESWPQPPAPSPFLPIRIQKKYNVPHASPERELAYARQLTRRLLTSADNVMVSSPQKDGDTALFPSPLIGHLAKVDILPNEKNWQLQMLNHADFDHIKDPAGPAADAKSHISGGTGLLKAQAACPFSAFAAHRLFAKPLEIPESGLNARDRGSLVHNALELFWEDVKSLDALKKMSDEALPEAVAKAVNRSIAEMAIKHPRAFPERFTELEKDRLNLLVTAFLAVDAQRTSFTVVGREQKMVRTIAGIELKTYADRIDKLDDGRLVIVDYKTGDPNIADWFTDRIAEPQLPLYSFAVDEEVAGVVFGQVKKGKVMYLGVVADAHIIPGAKVPGSKKGPMEHFNSLDEVIDLWKGKIELLADEVRQGIATVSPVSVHTSCRYCDLGPLCRIGEIDFLKP